MIKIGNKKAVGGYLGGLPICKIYKGEVMYMDFCGGGGDYPSDVKPNSIIYTTNGDFAYRLNDNASYTFSTQGAVKNYVDERPCDIGEINSIYGFCTANNITGRHPENLVKLDLSHLRVKLPIVSDISNYNWLTSAFQGCTSLEELNLTDTFNISEVAYDGYAYPYSTGYYCWNTWLGNTPNLKRIYCDADFYRWLCATWIGAAKTQEMFNDIEFIVKGLTKEEAYEIGFCTPLVKERQNIIIAHSVGTQTGDTYRKININGSAVTPNVLFTLDSKSALLFSISLRPTSLNKVFYSKYFKTVNCLYLDTSEVTDLNMAFYGSDIGEVFINNWDVSNVQDFTNSFYMFSQAIFNAKIDTLDISKWKPNPDAKFETMFASCNVRKLMINSFPALSGNIKNFFNGIKAEEIHVSREFYEDIITRKEDFGLNKTTFTAIDWYVDGKLMPKIDFDAMENEEFNRKLEEFNEYRNQYFTIEALTSDYFRRSDNSTYNGIQYSLNDGEWTELGTDDIYMSAGDKMRFKKNADSGYMIEYSCFINYAPELKVYGNVNSLYAGDDFLTDMRVYDGMFTHLFYNRKVIDATNLVFPYEKVTSNMCKQMFYSSGYIEKAPLILPATELSDNCYYQMFYGCSKLTVAPVLPAKVLKPSCYYFMFASSSKLNYIKCLAEEGIGVNDSTGLFAYNTASSGTFVKKRGVDWPSGTNGIPSNWTVEEID